MLITRTAWKGFHNTVEAPVRTMEDIRSPKLRQLYGWWSAAAGGDPPARRSFDIVEHRAIAPQTVLIDVLADGTFRTKIVGSLAQLWVEEDRERAVLSPSCDTPNTRWLFMHYTRLVSTRTAWVNSGRVRLAGRGEVTFEGIDCPLSGDDGTISAIVGVLDLLHP